MRSALKLGHARGVAMLAAVEAGLPVVEYTPAEIKRAVVGYGRAEKPQVQQMVKLLLGLDARADAARRRRRAGRGDLPPAHAAAAGRAPRSARRRAAARASRRAHEPGAQLPAPRDRATDDCATCAAACSRSSPTASSSTCSGVGYDVQVPLSTFYGARRAGRRRRAAHPHARARGRARAVRVRDALEQELFERLIAISGIGPKLALAVLSGIEPARARSRAVQRSDVARLTAIPGVGKKTAERIVLELKDRLPGVAAGADRPTPAPRRRPLRDDLLSAL